MTKRELKLFLALNDKLDRLIDEDGAIFELTHPWLFDSSLEAKIIDNEEIRERQRQNNESMKIVIDQLQQILAPKPLKGTQEELWRHD